MKWRVAAEAVLACGSEGRRRPLHECQRACMSVHDALRHTRGTRRVEDVRERILLTTRRQPAQCRRLIDSIPADAAGSRTDHSFEFVRPRFENLVQNAAAE